MKAEILERVEFRLPLPPARGNRRGHWLRHWRADADWAHRAELDLKGQGIRYPAQSWKRTRLTCTWRLTRQLMTDPDNLDSRRKLILDLLKEHWAGPDRHGRVVKLSKPPAAKKKAHTKIKPGFFADDSAEHVELGQSTIERVPVDAHVKVTLERLE